MFVAALLFFQKYFFFGKQSSKNLNKIKLQVRINITCFKNGENLILKLKLTRLFFSLFVYFIFQISIL